VLRNEGEGAENVTEPGIKKIESETYPEEERAPINSTQAKNNQKKKTHWTYPKEQQAKGQPRGVWVRENGEPHDGVGVIWTWTGGGWTKKRMYEKWARKKMEFSACAEWIVGAGKRGGSEEKKTEKIKLGVSMGKILKRKEWEGKQGTGGPR